MATRTPEELSDDEIAAVLRRQIDEATDARDADVLGALS